MKKNSLGFSLIELMVAVAIMGTLAGLTMISIRHMQAGYALRGATQALVSDIRLCRQKALSENCQYTIRFHYPDTVSYQVFCDNGAGGGIARNSRADGTEWRKVIRLPTGVYFLNPPSNSDSTTDFLPNGFTNAATQFILRNSQGQRYTVQLFLSGLVRP